MTDQDNAIGKLVTPDNETESTESAADAIGDWLDGSGTANDTSPGTLEDILGQQPRGQGMPTPEDMASTNASNAEERAKAIADGMDETTANIIYPDFSTPEDMLKIN